MDKPIEEWVRRMRGMDPKAVKKAWASKAADELSWVHESNFHAASAERMKSLANMAIDLDADTRNALFRQAESIHDFLEQRLSQQPDKLCEIRAFAEERDAYYALYGTGTARYYMYEQGVIDVLGDRKARR